MTNFEVKKISWSHLFSVFSPFFLSFPILSLSFSPLTLDFGYSYISLPPFLESSPLISFPKIIVTLPGYINFILEQVLIIWVGLDLIDKIFMVVKFRITGTVCGGRLATITIYDAVDVNYISEEEV